MAKKSVTKKSKEVKEEVVITHKPLPTSFEGRASQKEFSFSQLKREGDIALFEKKAELICYYEVIIVQKHNGREMPGGVKIPPSEFYPSDNMFGQYGWCFNDLDRASSKYDELCIKRKKHEN